MSPFQLPALAPPPLHSAWAGLLAKRGWETCPAHRHTRTLPGKWASPCQLAEEGARYPLPAVCNELIHQPSPQGVCVLQALRLQGQVDLRQTSFLWNGQAKVRKPSGCRTPRPDASSWSCHHSVPEPKGSDHLKQRRQRPGPASQDLLWLKNILGVPTLKCLQIPRPGPMTSQVVSNSSDTACRLGQNQHASPSSPTTFKPGLIPQS